MALSEDHEAGRISPFLFGALVGAGIALLLAPQSGEKVRRSLRDYAARVSDEGEDALDSATQAWHSAKERGRTICGEGEKIGARSGSPCKRRGRFREKRDA